MRFLKQGAYESLELDDLYRNRGAYETQKQQIGIFTPQRRINTDLDHLPYISDHH